MCIAHTDPRVCCHQSVALTVVHRHILKGEPLLRQRGRIDHYTVIRAVNIGVFQYICHRRAIEPKSLPLSRHPVVRQIVKHPVNAVSSQHHLAVDCSRRQQPAININARVLMKIQCRTGSNGQRRHRVHAYTPIDDDGPSLPVDGRVTVNHDIAHRHRVP